MQSITNQAQDKSLELAVRTRNAAVLWVHRAVERLREQEGQTAIEYAGILALVAVIFIGIFHAGIAHAVATWAKSVVDTINNNAKAGS
jgi:Flp pilus assembly pilin Flp